ncbi:PqqD family peptide modification chaperone [Lipingzhangella sp. LS1_29]|uniref:PqqD family peptide modification chaperone n=1 Tax=Lipingzhangella rawalii TaxID=2055835 RepID=A0ABU2H176_9ACTN|nr:PqqD family peptide modification chaperone [Lipingzhangella rawalii]
MYATITPEGGMLLDTRGRGRWYALSLTAAQLWHALASGTRLDDAAAALADDLGADPDQVRADAAVLVQELSRHGLLHRKRWRWSRW